VELDSSANGSCAAVTFPSRRFPPLRTERSHPYGIKAQDRLSPIRLINFAISTCPRSLSVIIEAETFIPRQQA
jgi:hypothetical protein